MGDITVANVEWEILDDIKDALAGATLSGVAIWDEVSVTTSEEKFSGQGKTEAAVAAVKYDNTEEDTSVQDCRLGVAFYRIFMSSKTNESGLDQSARVQEGLRLINAAKNAVEATPPANSRAVGDSDNYHDQIVWGEPEIDSGEPWVHVVLPIEVGFALATPTSH